MMATEQRPTMVLSQKPIVHYCGECEMPIEYCVYGQHPERCLQWLERNRPQLYQKMRPEHVEQCRVPATPTTIETVIIPQVREGRFASISSLDDLKKRVKRQAR